MKTPVVRGLGRLVARTLFPLFALALATTTTRAAVPVEYWDYRLPSSVGEDLLSVVHDGQRFLAVGDGGLMMSSPDGLHWADVTQRRENGDNKARLSRVVYENGVWFAFGPIWFGSYGDSQVSLDGVTWNLSGGFSNRIPLDVVHFNNQYIWIVSTTFFERGPDPLGAATQVEGFPNGNYQAIATGNHRAVVVGEQGFIIHSDNGITWTAAASGVTYSFRDVEYLGDAFYAVGDQDVILRSPDGVTWTKVYENPTQLFPSLTGIARMGDTWIAVGGQGRALRSGNGLDWAPITGFPTQVACRDVAAGNGRWVIVGDGGLRLTSTDGVTWTGLVPDRPAFTLGLATNGTTVATAPAASAALYSRDGITWRRSTTTSLSLSTQVVWFKDHYYAGGTSGLNLRSTTGETWEAYPTPVTSPVSFLGIAGNALYVAFQDGQERRTTDGIDWQSFPLPDNALIDGIAAGNNIYLLTTSGGQLFTSPDGITWTLVPSFTTHHEVVFGNGRFVSSGDSGLSHSIDGVNWSPATIEPVERRGKIVFTGEAFVFGGLGGQIVWSADGITWTKRFTPISGDLRHIVAFQGTLIASTSKSQLVQSRQAPPEKGLANISARAPLLAGDDSLIAGFVFEGAAKTLLLRGVGQSMGLSAAITDPRMQLFRGQTEFPGNDDWTLFADQARLQSTTTAVFAFPLLPGTKEASGVFDLAPGAVTAVIKNKPQQPGIALAEVYDADGPLAPNPGRLVNLSARSTVLTGDSILIGGFVIHAGRPAKILVRGVGPALTDFGVTNALADPHLKIYSGQTVIATNDDWDEIANPAQTAFLGQQFGAFPLAAGSGDAALVLYLAPGNYTAHLTGVNGGTGTALMEVYLLE